MIFKKCSHFTSVISIVLSTESTRVVYDHWEDGYEVDLNNPAQASTRIWGDGKMAPKCVSDLAACG